MYVITTDDNFIVYISEKAEKKESGIYLENEDVMIGYKVNIYELETVPEEITPYEWSYTEDQDFYPTPPPPDPEPEPKTESEIIGEELIKIKFESMQKDLLLNSMGTQLTDMKLANMQKDALMNSLGQEVTKLKLEMMSMKGGESG
ncbi:hypothetical protein [Bacillus infantis]|nr:hypothetical protein [Bacillus infantis]